MPNCRCYSQNDWYAEAVPTSASAQTEEDCILLSPLSSAETTVIHVADGGNANI